MAYFLDIAGLFIYLLFRVLILPVLAVVGCLFLLLAVAKGLHKLRKLSIRIKPIAPLYRFVRLLPNFTK